MENTNQRKIGDIVYSSPEVARFMAYEMGDVDRTNTPISSQERKETIDSKVNRTSPKSPFLTEMVGNNQALIESAHHGLVECSALKDFYPNLDFYELFAFAASSYKSREKEEMSYLTQDINAYDLFSRALKIGMPWLNTALNISRAHLGKNREQHIRLNPFNGSNLKDRLGRISLVDLERLKSQLASKPNKYVFECQYEDMARRQEDRANVISMSFQNVYPKAGRIIPAYAAEISRILSEYPKEVNLK